ncbi:MAG: DUF1015 domain-containing protein [Ignavibacteria bacterium]|nr:DUF1015 domain-containing protein [Ignavibacteria bacterium]
MAEIVPFRGLHYNPSRVSVEKVVAPPYDVISPAYKEELYSLSPYNVVRLILGKEEDPYKEAATYLASWQQEGILTRDGSPSIYLLSQSFKVGDGFTNQRFGFIGACRLEEFSKGIILPHEKTHSKPKEDRFKLMQATNTNFSQIFALYSDLDGEVDALLKRVMSTPPLVEVLFETVMNRIWRVGGRAIVDGIATEMKGKSVLIADGHHRYETALAYRDMIRLKTPSFTGTEPFNFTMMFLTNMDAQGLVIFPTHRVVHGLPTLDPAKFQMQLSRHFMIEAVSSTEQLLSTLAPKQEYAFGVAMKTGMFVIDLKSKELLNELIETSIPPEVRGLDVTLLHSHIIGSLLGVTPRSQELKENLDYVKEATEALEAVKKGAAQVAFILNPTRISQVRNVARTGHTMPQKSTYFYPKLLSGLVMNKLD